MPLAQRQFSLEGPGDLQNVCIVGFDCIMHNGPADLSGLVGFSQPLIRKSERKGAVRKIHRTVGIMDLFGLCQQFFSVLQFVSVIMDE